MKTAVEFLKEAIFSKGTFIAVGDGDDEFCIELSVLKELFKQTNEMFEQQIQDAYRINPNNELWSNSGIDYYNETFKQQEQ
jgi:hypothetical protein